MADSVKNKSYFPASAIARAVQHDKKTVVRLAARDGWPRRKFGNRFEFQPPLALRKKCLKIIQRAKGAGLSGFWIGPERRAEIVRSHNRFAAICALEIAVQSGMQFERALARVSRDFSFHCGPTSLRRWQRQFATKGYAGLLEGKRGHSGRRAGVKR